MAVASVPTTACTKPTSSLLSKKALRSTCLPWEHTRSSKQIKERERARASEDFLHLSSSAVTTKCNPPLTPLFLPAAVFSPSFQTELEGFESGGRVMVVTVYARMYVRLCGECKILTLKQKQGREKKKILTSLVALLARLKCLPKLLLLL